MAKRFTDTDKFTDPWYRRLSTKNKLLWDWMLCSCDHAGFISIDLEFVELVLGEKYEDNVIETYFFERVLKLGDFKFFIPKFIKFQYGPLNPESRVHLSVIKKLEEHGINLKGIDTLCIPYEYPIDTLKDKDKDKDKVMDKAKAKAKANTKECVIIPEASDITDGRDKSPTQLYKIASGKVRPDQVIQLFNETLAGVGSLKYCYGLGANDTKELLNTFEILPTLDKWSDLFASVKSNTALTGASKTVFLASLDWLAKKDNALRVLSGKYDVPNPLEVSNSSIDDLVRKALA